MKSRFLFSLLAFCFFSQALYANLDQTGKVTYSYTCTDGVGILTISSKSAQKIIYTNTYRIDHAGYVYSRSPVGILTGTVWFGISQGAGYSIPGCGCPAPLGRSEVVIQATSYFRDGKPDEVATSEEIRTVAGWKTGLRDALIFEPITGGGVPMNCVSRVCGDGKKDATELCDPNDREHENWGPEGCSASCVPIGASSSESTGVCGDGKKDATELCDPNDSERTNWGTDGCSISCEPIFPENPCGNGVKDSSEVCDPKDATKAGWGNNGCSLLCTPISADNGYCGDGLKQGNELCDPNDIQKLHWGKYGCDALCKRVEQCIGDLCNLSLTGITITEKKVCFEIRNTGGEYMTGLELITTLSTDGNSYVKKVIQSQNEEYTTDVIRVVGNHYCADFSSTVGFPPGETHFTLAVDCIGLNTCMLTNPGGVILTPKKCTGKLEVFQDGQWTDNEILYDTPQEYRVVVEGSNPECTGGVLNMNTEKAFTATGGTLSNASRWLSSTGTFMATILSGENPLGTYRGVSLGIMYTTPGGSYSYGLTASPTDFTDTPLSIIGNKIQGVRVIGSMVSASDNKYNISAENIISSVSAYSSILNTIQKNIASLIRGVSEGVVTNDIVFYTRENLSYTNDVTDKNFKTLIVYGNLVIDQNIENTKGIIVLKDTNGNGGNVIIADNVKNIHAIIFAEGILRGASTTPNTLNPSSQLILKGALYARNTIGGSADSSNLFLYPNVKTTDKTQAFLQDLNNVRSGIQTGESYLGYTDPFIIHYDSSFIQDPPPGF